MSSNAVAVRALAYAGDTGSPHLVEVVAGLAHLGALVATDA